MIWICGYSNWSMCDGAFVVPEGAEQVFVNVDRVIGIKAAAGGVAVLTIEANNTTFHIFVPDDAAKFARRLADTTSGVVS